MAGRDRAGLLAGLCVAVLAGSASGQCESEWSDRFTPAFFSGGYSSSAVVFDDGSGPKLIVSGLVRAEDGLRGLQVWNGQAWSTMPLPTEATGAEQMLFADNLHDPPRLLMVDSIDTVRLGGVYIYEDAQWRSTGASSVFSHVSAVQSILPGLDPESDELYLGGNLRWMDDSESGVVRWDGQSWESLCNTNTAGFDMEWFDDGAGPMLYATAREQIDGVWVLGVGRWTGSQWEALGDRYPFYPYYPSSLVVHDDGTGEALWAFAGWNDQLAKWDGTAWTPYSLGPDYEGFSYWHRSVLIGGERTLCWSDHRLYNPGLWKWDGQQGQLIGRVDGESLWQIADDPTDQLGEGVFACGEFIGAGGTAAQSVIRWDGEGWHAVGNDDTGNGVPDATTVLSVGSMGAPSIDRRVYTAATAAGGQPAHGLASWDGSTWRALGRSDYEYFRPRALELADFGDGPLVVAAGSIRRDYAGTHEVAAWDGQSWATLGDGIEDGAVYTMAFGSVAGQEPTLYVAGSFDDIAGEPYNDIAALTPDGWEKLGDGLPSVPNYPTNVLTMTLHDDGSGVRLYAGGRLSYLDPPLARGVVQWDGQAWTRLGEPLGPEASSVNVLLSADIGDGPTLYAGGWYFDGNTQLNVARWTGSEWSTLHMGIPGSVSQLQVVQTPEGPRLVATGSSSADSGPEDRLYIWDGARWNPYGSQANAAVYHILRPSWEPGATYLLGYFTEVAGVPSEGIARFGCECPPDFNADGTLDTRDFIAFLNAWAAGNDAADFDGNGVLDTRDFVAYLGAWAIGC